MSGFFQGFVAFFVGFVAVNLFLSWLEYMVTGKWSWGVPFSYYISRWRDRRKCER